MVGYVYSTVMFTVCLCRLSRLRLPGAFKFIVRKCEKYVSSKFKY